MKLSQLLNQPLQTDPEISGLAIDSRQVHPGYLFCAYKGFHQDGSHFIGDAIAKGAAAILTDRKASADNTSAAAIPHISIVDLQHKLGEIAARFYQYPAKKLRVIGVTGTNGKTSCSHFIAACLQQKNIPCGVIGTLGNGLYGQIKSSSMTTPDAITLQSIFHAFLKEGAKAVAMEVSSHSLDQGRVNGINFEVGVFTNLSRDHLDYHQTMEAYGCAKKKLFENPNLKNAVINGDDAFGRQIIQSIDHLPKYIYGFSNEISKYPSSKTLFASNIRCHITGIQAHLKTPWGEGEIELPIIGKFNLSNVLATIATLCLLDFSFVEAIKAVREIHPVPGRMQMFGDENKPLVVVDYAHSPDAIEKVLLALREHTAGELYCLFGCGGDRDRGKRPLMAKIVEQYADHIVISNDNPRTEDPVQIVNDILQGFSYPKKVKIEYNRSKAIKDIIQYAKPGDCVLIAGKGAETYQIIGADKIPFSDVEEVKKLLT